MSTMITHVKNVRSPTCVVELLLRRGGEGPLETHLNDVEQFMSINAAIAIYIIQFEIPPQFLFHLPTENKAEGSHIFHEVNISILWQNKNQLVTGTGGAVALELLYLIPV